MNRGIGQPLANRSRPFPARPIIFCLFIRNQLVLGFNMLFFFLFTNTHNLALQILLSVPLVRINYFFFAVNGRQIFGY